MKILVGVKHVPDTETKIRIAPEGNDIVRDGIKYVLNPYDELAVEQALLLKENCTVTLARRVESAGNSACAVGLAAVLVVTFKVLPLLLPHWLG